MIELPDLGSMDPEYLKALEEQLEAERWRRARIGTGPAEIGETIRRWAARCGIACDRVNELHDYDLGREALAAALEISEGEVDAEVEKVLEDPGRNETFQYDPEQEEAA
ncbi:hypothetical protein [uncultured Stenotrophomonas sp.]|uniref:hypothetical protein n=1 Tax=uncultured Stenotrophomonas sp. TaxID=165438 RepID=UPI0025D4E10D|nr:hypothetical protein [uncultured Stenotrophomonas sp.]